ncbi:unnamed protein product [Prunus armeniaca]
MVASHSLSSSTVFGIGLLPTPHVGFLGNSSRSNHRFSHGQECQICGKRGHTAANCNHRHLSAMTAHTFYSPKQVWIVDSGVSHHMVSDVSRLNNATHCDSIKQVTVGNGEGLAINHIGHAAISSCLKLPIIFHVPQLKANLLSVHQLCKNNICLITFDASSFCIQDRLTNQVLLRGKNNNGLYLILYVSP